MKEGLSHSTRPLELFFWLCIVALPAAAESRHQGTLDDDSEQSDTSETDTGGEITDEEKLAKERTRAQLTKMGFKKTKDGWDATEADLNTNDLSSDPEIAEALNSIDPTLAEQLSNPKRKGAFSVGENVFLPPDEKGKIRVYSAKEFGDIIKARFDQFTQEKDRYLLNSKKASSYWDSMTGKFRIPWTGIGVERGLDGKTAAEIDRDSARQNMVKIREGLRELGVSPDKLLEMGAVSAAADKDDRAAVVANHRALTATMIAAPIVAFAPPVALFAATVAGGTGAAAVVAGGVTYSTGVLAPVAAPSVATLGGATSVALSGAAIVMTADAVTQTAGIIDGKRDGLDPVESGVAGGMGLAIAPVVVAAPSVGVGLGITGAVQQGGEMVANLKEGNYASATANGVNATLSAAGAAQSLSAARVPVDTRTPAMARAQARKNLLNREPASRDTSYQREAVIAKTDPDNGTVSLKFYDGKHNTITYSPEVVPGGKIQYNVTRTVNNVEAQRYTTPAASRAQDVGPRTASSIRANNRSRIRAEAERRKPAPGERLLKTIR